MVGARPGRDGRRAGTLTLPEGDGPFPAVLLISGAGSQDRNYEALGHRPFLVLADHLTRSGIVVLRMDDRGSGGSGGDAAKASVADIEAVVDLLRTDLRIDAVGLIAHSEGGRIAPLAAGEIEDVAFVVLLAPPAIPAGERPEGAGGSHPRSLGRPPRPRAGRTRHDDPANRPRRAGSRPRHDRDHDRLGRLPRDAAGGSGENSRGPPTPGRFSGPGPAAARAARHTVEPRALQAGSGSAPAVPRRTGPALYGDRDRQAPPESNVPALEAAWADQPDATIRVIPALNHFLQHAETGLPSEIPQIEETLAPEALDAVSDWIEERFAR